MSKIWTFDHIENKHNLYWSRLPGKVLWIFIRTQKKYHWFWKEKKMLSLTKKLKSHQDPKECYTCRIKFVKRLTKDNNHQEVRDHFYNTGMVNIVCVIYDLMCPMKFL